jgi:3-methyladenine DNA glycosylase AlkD
LSTDQDVMVQKGYGWMLKEASNHYPKEVFDYVMKNRREMPRTALRYAIEKLSPEHRIEAMKKERMTFDARALERSSPSN